MIEIGKNYKRKFVNDSATYLCIGIHDDFKWFHSDRGDYFTTNQTEYFTEIKPEEWAALHWDNIVKTIVKVSSQRYTSKKDCIIGWRNVPCFIRAIRTDDGDNERTV